LRKYDSRWYMLLMILQPAHPADKAAGTFVLKGLPTEYIACDVQHEQG
jgi:hypothetical protein